MKIGFTKLQKAFFLFVEKLVNTGDYFSPSAKKPLLENSSSVTIFDYPCSR